MPVARGDEPRRDDQVLRRDDVDARRRRLLDREQPRGADLVLHLADREPPPERDLLERADADAEQHREDREHDEQLHEREAARTRETAREHVRDGSAAGRSLSGTT